MAYKALVANVLKWQPDGVRRMELMSDVQIGDAALVGTAPKRVAVQPRRLVTMSPAYRKIMVAATDVSVYDDVSSHTSHGAPQFPCLTLPDFTQCTFAERCPVSALGALR